MTVLRNLLVLVLVFAIVYGDEHNHIVSICDSLHTEIDMCKLKAIELWIG